MRAPAPSLRPIIGAPTDSARSITLWIFSANTSPSAPPNTVKSWLNTNTLRPSTDAPAGDDAVGERPGVLDAEPVGAVAGEHVELDERVGIEQELDPLTRGELAALVLALDRRRAAGVQRLLAQLGELLEPLLDRVDGVEHGFLDGHSARRGYRAREHGPAGKRRGRMRDQRGTGQFVAEPTSMRLGAAPCWISTLRALACSATGIAMLSTPAS